MVFVATANAVTFFFHQGHPQNLRLGVAEAPCYYSASVSLSPGVLHLPVTARHACGQPAFRAVSLAGRPLVHLYSSLGKPMIERKNRKIDWINSI